MKLYPIFFLSKKVGRSVELFKSIYRVDCIKSARIGSYFGPLFPTFGLNADQNNSEYEHFSRSGKI